MIVRDDLPILARYPKTAMWGLWVAATLSAALTMWLEVNGDLHYSLNFSVRNGTLLFFLGLASGLALTSVFSFFRIKNISTITFIFCIIIVIYFLFYIIFFNSNYLICRIVSYCFLCMSIYLFVFLVAICILELQKSR